MKALFLSSKFVLHFTLLLFAAMLFATFPAYSQAVEGNPAAAVSEESIAAMTAAITLFITYFSKVIPGLKNIKQGLIRAIAVGTVVVFAVIEFRFGWFTRESFEAIMKNLAPTFAYSVFAWELIRTVLALFKIDVKATRPGAKKATAVPPNVNHTL
jgi:hypothetical protein